MAENNMLEIKKAFESETKPLSMEEFKEFWNSLTETEKVWLKSADLSEFKS
jgi:hypothetical protein